ncbi:MAG: exodeoxyribonuclease VII small subunit [Candidatus Eremiobacteraeota bacterium]|nr:exodeoxyribonuclease VII small subunit [Candidatus Eremiobacteraeota bacterium]MBC5804233.1 exodeoxyribonuclease VII small subunit [Candidatus Eremiobacteraeota bacterium]MBC5820390.1 exodeoxyribonuclease VII small subunit [Candidatus Eremiobacteraeota bacterium]
MPTNASGEFENALQRLEAIVAKLEGQSISLDESVALFREGKRLAAQCEALLKNAQSSIEAASRGESAAPGATGAPGTAPEPPQPQPAMRNTPTPLFAETIVDDADPDL